MAERKLSPRQRMINMMYLVLTALLALNVSKEVLDSFFEVNKGIERTTTNFFSKNVETYSDFDKAIERIIELDNNIGKIVSPTSYILGTHLRDIYMTHRLHNICKGNPNKTVAVIVGACHTFGIRDMWNYNLPTSITNNLENEYKTRKNLLKELEKYGGSLINKINYKKLVK